MPINYKEYPPNWKTEIRPAVLNRANNCCEECGVPNYAIIYRPVKGSAAWKFAFGNHQDDAMGIDGIKFTKIILTIAHLDHDKLNHDVYLDRLKALCQRCHLVYDNSRHVANRKYGRNHSTNNYKMDFDNTVLSPPNT
jgi:hypothetical protein